MTTDWALFFGRFHPLFVHLPIGILLLVALLEWIAIFRKSTQLQVAINIGLLAGALSAGVAAWAGYCLAGAGGYNEKSLFWHQWMGISVVVLSGVAWTLKQYPKVDKPVRHLPLSQWIVTGTLVLIGVTGHLGGNLTHGSTYLTDYMPLPFKTFFVSSIESGSIVRLPATVDSVRLYEHVVKPILTARCVGCHNSDKAQGDLMLDSEAGITRGGSSGPAIQPGDVDKSELIKRVTLPPTSEKFMPANHLPPLTNVEIGLLKWWITKGADFNGTLVSAKADEKFTYLVATYLGMNAETSPKAALPTVGAATSTALNALQNTAVLVKPLSEGSNLLDVSFVMAGKATPVQRGEQLKNLLAIRHQVYWLDVSNCHLTDDDLKVLAQLPNLTKLRLQKNSITDKGIGYLKGLTKLTVLNAYQNPLTDQSVATIQQLPALKEVDLWQTGVSENGVAKLKAAKAELVVNR